jgi:hypothetical protein
MERFYLPRLLFTLFVNKAMQEKVMWALDEWLTEDKKPI